MSHRTFTRVSLSAFAVSILTAITGPVVAELYINEIMFDPGGNGSDTQDEYIELRGAAGMSLENTYLIFLENEDNSSHSGATGQIDNIFDLGSYSMGSNGFLTLRQNGTRYADPAPGTTDLVNRGPGAGVGWGSGSTSLVGASDELDEGVIENGGFTAMLIRNNGDPVANKPTIGFDLDVGNDGLDLPTGRADWTILDSIGVHAEGAEAFYGRTYAPVNFGVLKVGTEVLPGIFFDTPNIEPGATYVGTGFEVEYMARWGNSTGHASDDWHMSNLTDKGEAGSQGVPDWRQSCIDGAGCHPINDGNPLTPPPLGLPTESNKAVPYGTRLTDNIGAPNFLLGDYNKDGYVDAADYTVWRDSLGATGSDTNQLAADADHDYVVGVSDYAFWKAHFGEPFNSSGAGALAGSTNVPEPTTLLLFAMAGTIAAILRPTSRRESN